MIIVIILFTFANGERPRRKETLSNKLFLIYLLVIVVIVIVLLLLLFPLPDGERPRREEAASLRHRGARAEPAPTTAPQGTRAVRVESH